MGIFNWFSDWWSGAGSLNGISTTASSSDSRPLIEPTVINPATNLPMVGGMGGVDVSGNPYGVDLHSHHEIYSSSSSASDSWTSSSSYDSTYDWGSSSSMDMGFGGSSWDD